MRINSAPFRWSPKGCSDTLDTTETFPGAMTALQNLVPDPTTQNLWVCRPAAIAKTAFTSFNTPGFISALLVVGTRAYGMIASARNGGKDEPFAFDLVAGNFITISGVTSGNTPTSPPSSGTWTPPTMALVGTKVTVTHPGFDGVTNFVGWLDIANPATPSWSAGNTATNALPAVPTFVAQFSGRAYYGCNPATGQPSVIASDILDPKTVTNSTYVLTFGDNVKLTAAAGLPLENQLGGIVQSLMVFKGAANVYQITGDFAGSPSTIALNTLNVATGTQSPLSICTTPKGLMFVAPDGLRLIDFAARMSDPIGIAGKGIALPFANALVPSRVVAACNSTTIRVSVQNGAAAGSPMQEWWYDLTREVWSGPHTLPASLIQPFGLSFVMTPASVIGSLWQSDVVPSSTSTYVENGSQLQWAYQTAFFPDMQQMAMYSIIESLLYLAFGTGSPTYTVSVQDDSNTVLNSISVVAPVVALPLWGTAVWGAFLWSGGISTLRARQLNWTLPLTFSRLSLTALGVSAAGFRIGDLYGRWRALNYRPGG